MFDEAWIAFEVLTGQDPDRAEELRQETWFPLESPDRDVMAGLWSRIAVGNSGGATANP